jgi:Zn-finger nucleic acid-binding protein
MELTCPKCHAPMRSYERSGVTVDQCSECRGIFLDRGELERLIDADTRFHADDRAATPQPPPQQYQQPSYGGQSYGGQSYGHKPHKRRKSFFEELFD